MQQLKNIYCSNPNCKKLLGQWNGTKIKPVNEKVFSKLLSHKKKKENPLYCVYCHRITYRVKEKFKQQAYKNKIANKKGLI